MKNAIETANLSKSFGDVRAVDSVSLHVKFGEIYGFLGINGAGKTTTIRALLGMIHPTTGTVRLLDEAVDGLGHGPWKRVGYLVEMPSAYPELSVRENLEIARRLYGIKDTSVVARIIQELGLQPYSERKAGTLSLGNLQRLGLARALLHEPEVLILDEPANGLDPAGIAEIRALLARLAGEQGVAILMSSHILTEVDRLAHRIGIIHHGRLVAELDAEALEQYREHTLIVNTRDRDAAIKILTAAGYSPTASTTEAGIVLQERKAVDSPDEVARILVQGGAALTHLTIHQENLEEYFLRLTGGEQ